MKARDAEVSTSDSHVSDDEQSSVNDGTACDQHMQHSIAQQNVVVSMPDQHAGAKATLWQSTINNQHIDFSMPDQHVDINMLQ